MSTMETLKVGVRGEARCTVSKENTALTKGSGDFDEKGGDSNG